MPIHKPIEIPKKRTIVHLGNVGEDAARKTREYAERFKGFKFIGIDKAELKANTPNEIRKNTLHPSNFEQIQNEFLLGLHKLENNSVNIISSDFAVGHYNLTNSVKGEKILQAMSKNSTIFTKQEYTRKILRLCHQKLVPGGKLHFLVFTTQIDKSALKNIVDGAKRIKFSKTNVEEVSAEKIDKLPNAWAKSLAQRALEEIKSYKLYNIKFYRITLVK
jgi:hypothetical protein